MDVEPSTTVCGSYATYSFILASFCIYIQFRYFRLSKMSIVTTHIQIAYMVISTTSSVIKLTVELGSI